MNAPIRQIREKKRDVLLILATAVLLALAINSATSYLAVVNQNRPFDLLVFGATCLLGGILLLRRAVFGHNEHVVRLDGAVAFKMKGEMVDRIRIIGYSFNDDFCEYLGGFIRENKAYAKLFIKADPGIVSMETFSPDNLNRKTIINSVLEFLVLNELQLHLGSYFVENEIDRDRIVALSREHLGAGVLKNRVIDLITKDMKERAAFVEESDSEVGGAIVRSGADSVGVVYSSSRGGAVYERLEIELPPKSTIFRNSNGFLVIANPLFELTIMPKFEGFNTTVSSVLAPSVSGHWAPLQAQIKLHVRIKRAAFFSGEDLEMYEWLDSFVERMHDYVSIERLERRLDPDLIKLLKG